MLIITQLDRGFIKIVTPLLIVDGFRQVISKETKGTVSTPGEEI